MVSVAIFTVLPIDPNLTSTCIGIIILKTESCNLHQVGRKERVLSGFSHWTLTSWWFAGKRILDVPVLLTIHVSESPNLRKTSQRWSSI